MPSNQNKIRVETGFALSPALREPETRQAASLLGGFDPAAANNNVAIIENGRLARG